MTATPDIDRLEAEAAEAQAKANAARTAAAEAQRAEQERQAARRLEHAATVVDSYDRDVLEEQFQAARQRFEQVALETPFVQAWVELYAAATRRYIAWTEARDEAQRLGEELPAVWRNSPGHNEAVEKIEALERLIAAAGAQKVDDEKAAAEDWRERWIAGTDPHPAADGEPREPGPPADDGSAHNWHAGAGHATGAGVRFGRRP
jgi:hypothetical protein